MAKKFHCINNSQLGKSFTSKPYYKIKKPCKRKATSYLLQGFFYPYPFYTLDQELMGLQSVLEPHEKVLYFHIPRKYFFIFQRYFHIPQRYYFISQRYFHISQRYYPRPFKNKDKPGNCRAGRREHRGDRAEQRPECRNTTLHKPP